MRHYLWPRRAAPGTQLSPPSVPCPFLCEGTEHIHFCRPAWYVINIHVYFSSLNRSWAGLHTNWFSPPAVGLLAAPVGPQKYKLNISEWPCSPDRGSLDSSFVSLPFPLSGLYYGHIWAASQGLLSNFVKGLEGGKWISFSVELGKLNGTAASMCHIRSKQLQQALSITGSESSKWEMAGALAGLCLQKGVFLGLERPAL